jgi:hypothetical protein
VHWFLAQAYVISGRACLDFVSEYLPKTGAVGINLMGGDRHVCRIIVYNVYGGVYDKLILKQLPPGADLKVYNATESHSPDEGEHWQRRIKQQVLK